MRRAAALVCALLMATLSCGRAGNASDTGRIIALERSALDRWGKGDPQGYLETYAAEVTYFDPMVGRRLDGLPVVRRVLASISGKVRVDRFEMIDPQVRIYGDVAVLTFNLVDYVAGGDDTLRVGWNSTEVYRRLNGSWRIVHSHWSLTGSPPQQAGP